MDDGRFGYNSELPLQLRVGEEEIRDVSFASPRGGTVPALLVSPPAAGAAAAPGVLLMHGGSGDRAEFLGDAIELASHGAVCLLISAEHARPPRRRLFEHTTRDTDSIAHTVVDLRRGVDVLRSLPAVDSGRLGYVGWSYGSTLGALLAAVERRITSYVLMAGGPRLSDFVETRLAAHPDTAGRLAAGGFADYLARLREFDPVRHIGRAAPGSLFFQNAEHDSNVTRDAVEELLAAAPEPTEVRWYDAGHALNDAARRDRLAWLRQRLAF